MLTKKGSSFSSSSIASVVNTQIDLLGVLENDIKMFFDSVFTVFTSFKTTININTNSNRSCCMSTTTHKLQRRIVFSVPLVSAWGSNKPISV